MRPIQRRRAFLLSSGTRLLIVTLSFAVAFAPVAANTSGEAVERVYHTAPPAPTSQSAADVAQKSAGCTSCHTRTDRASMHASAAVKLGCIDCHGGDAGIHLPSGNAAGDTTYNDTMARGACLAAFLTGGRRARIRSAKIRQQNQEPSGVRPPS
jgi:hypothetical protein